MFEILCFFGDFFGDFEKGFTFIVWTLKYFETDWMKGGFANKIREEKFWLRDVISVCSHFDIRRVRALYNNYLAILIGFVSA